MEASPVSDVPATGGVEDDGLCLPNTVMGWNLFKGGQQLSAAESDPRLETVLHGWCQTLCARYDAPHGYVRRVEGEMKSISQTLGADLVGHITTAFDNAYLEHTSIGLETAVSSVKYDRQLDALSMVQDIKVLQARLDATKDEDEQRALEEDVTGKVLWLFWCGICAEVDELIPKVVDYIRRKGSIEGLWKIRVVASVSTDPCDDQAHLQRIMYDAGANTSKHQLWLDARASEQAKWPCTDRSTPTVDNQGTPPSTSRQTPSTSIVRTTSVSVLPAQKQKLSESHGATTDVGADDQVANGGTRWLRRQAWYGADGWVSRLVVISYPAVMAFVIRALSVQ